MATTGFPASSEPRRPSGASYARVLQGPPASRFDVDWSMPITPRGPAASDPWVDANGDPLRAPAATPGPRKGEGRPWYWAQPGGSELVRRLQDEAPSNADMHDLAVSGALGYARDKTAPNEWRGCLYAAQIDDNSRGDACHFRFFPENLPFDLRTQLAQEIVPGRAFPVFQDMGGGGMGLTLDLQFYDAFLPANPTPEDSKNNYYMMSRARRAMTWLTLYTLGHDGTGTSIPPVDIWLQLGYAAPMYLVAIKGVTMGATLFDRNHFPQALQATVQLEFVVKQQLVSPFQPRKPDVVRTQKKAPVMECRVVPPGCELVVVCGGVSEASVPDSGSAGSVAAAELMSVDTSPKPVVTGGPATVADLDRALKALSNDRGW